MPLERARRAARGVRILARTLLVLFFRRVEVSGLENLPPQGGGLLLAWHPNGLIDPALLLATFPGRVVFGARHGLFRWPLLGSLLRAVAVPIFRRQDLPAGGDSAAARRGNEASLAALAEAVLGGKFAVLFPEGDSHDEPHPLALRTGAARLLVDASRRAGRAPLVVPVGLHYDRKRFFRSRALVEYHPPLDLAAELEGASGDEAAGRAAVERLTARFATVLDETVLATADWQEHYLMHRLRRLMRAERAARAGLAPGPAAMRERRLGFARVWSAQRQLGGAAAAPVAALTARLADYDRRVRRLGLEEHELDRDPPAPHGRVLAALAAQRFVLDALVPPLAAIGVLANLPTALLLSALVRTAARRKKDAATIKLLGGAVLFPATWIGIGALAGWGQGFLHRLYPTVPHWPWATGVLAVLLSAAGGVLVLVYGRLSRHWGRALLVRAKRRWLKRPIARLLAERAAIFDAATALSAGLDLPGRVAADGRIVAAAATRPAGPTYPTPGATPP
jgi:1-acyl-sn-glycerol-3-phosphate acyltransferase